MGFVRFHPDIQLGNGNFDPGVLKTVLTVTVYSTGKVMLGAKECSPVCGLHTGYRLNVVTSASLPDAIAATAFNAIAFQRQ
ncbi:Uncharacterised protein [Escherichia coli]|uniref:Uncharacterized protein n=1 Tax=Escherichia coli TaxID=562 RepID=A0A3S4KWE5_ECOLX|nr:Uncharacterised protein [Escherichia coli]